ncbi:hypothetical protein H4684_003034 [Desulfomicrobium macestii]|uniref:Uncharacterized protein n=1 Tax=Desulfomicrobium macestii TaxID=90731 RepID=A0ABR9H6M8_9BACT|nr:hypothetical protein [Desulfomicrobium macestii]
MDLAPDTGLIIIHETDQMQAGIANVQNFLSYASTIGVSPDNKRPYTGLGRAKICG